MSSSIKAILGGTFSPPHLGHINAALHAADSLGIPHVHLMPCKLPPHKAVDVSEVHRVNMIKCCCEENSRLIPELIELTLPSPSYTVKTLRAMRESHKGAICFFIGADSLYNLNKWYEWERLLEYCHLVVMRRDTETFNVPSAINAWLDKHVTNDTDVINVQNQGAVLLTNTPLYPVSSTDIRHVLATTLHSGETDQGDASAYNDIVKWLSPRVLEYIKAHQLYKFK